MLGDRVDLQLLVDGRFGAAQQRDHFTRRLSVGYVISEDDSADISGEAGEYLVGY